MASSERSHPLATADRLQSVSRAMAVLDVLAAHPEGQTAKGVAAALGLNLSTAYHLLNSLAAGGYVAREPMTRLFALGPRIPHLHQSFLARGLPAPSTLPFVHALRHATGETVHLCRLFGDDAVSVAMSEAPHAHAPIPGYVGAALPAHLIAAGQALLAWASPQRLQAYLNGPYGRAGNVTPRLDLDQFPSVLQRIREQGYALDNGENTAQMCCLAAPIVLDSTHAEEALVIVTTCDHYAAQGQAILATMLSLAQSAAAARLSCSQAARAKPNELSDSALATASVRAYGLPG